MTSCAPAQASGKPANTKLPALSVVVEAVQPVFLPA